MRIDTRINEIKNVLGISQAQLAEALGKTQASISRYLSGQSTPDADFLSALADVYKINGNWLLTGQGDMFVRPSDHVSQAISHVLNSKGFEVAQGSCNLVEIPISGIIAAGKPAENHNLEPLGNVQIALPDPQNYVAFQVRGDSMTPQIEPDDVVLIRHELDWRECEGRVCAIQADWELTLKRLLLDKRTGQAVLLPFNKLHDPIILDPDSTDTRIIGVLAYLIRKF